MSSRGISPRRRGRAAQLFLSSIVLVYFAIQLLFGCKLGDTHFGTEQVGSFSSPIASQSKNVPPSKIVEDKTSSPSITTTAVSTHTAHSSTRSMRDFASCVKNRCEFENDSFEVMSIPIVGVSSGTYDGGGAAIDRVSYETHMCVEAKIAFLHVFKSAGTSAGELFAKACVQVTGKETIVCSYFSDKVNDNCKQQFASMLDPNNVDQWVQWTVIREPISRFKSSMFEVARRHVDAWHGKKQLVDAYTNLKGPVLSDVDTTSVIKNFIDIEIVGRLKQVCGQGGDSGRGGRNSKWERRADIWFDPHLLPQLEFLVREGAAFRNLDFIISMEEGDLIEKINSALTEMFSKSLGSTHTISYRNIYNKRNHSSLEYNSEDSDPDMKFFKNLKVDDFNNEILSWINQLYHWDIECFQKCGGVSSETHTQ